MGSGCSTADVAVGSNPSGCWPFFLHVSPFFLNSNGLYPVLLVADLNAIHFDNVTCWPRCCSFALSVTSNF